MTAPSPSPPADNNSNNDDSNNNNNRPLHDGGFENLLNFRDVAATINAHRASSSSQSGGDGPAQGHPLLRPGLLYRSARPDEATPADRARLHTHYHLQTVIDLRSKTEHAKAAQKRAADPAHKDLANAPAAMATTSNKALAQPVQQGDDHRIPGVTYHNIRVTGSGFESHMLSQLSWWDFLRLIFFYAIGQRMTAIAILGRQVMAPRGLLGLACDTLDASGPDIAAGLHVFLGKESAAGTNGPSNGRDGLTDGHEAKGDSASLPLLIHCTQGKDRTGLMVALVLLICKVSLDDIEYDYELTDEKLVQEQQERLAEIREMGLPDSFGKTVHGFVPGIVAHLDSKYGGLEAYLDGIGFGADKRSQLQDMLLC